jgi:hypothetical protein
LYYFCKTPKPQNPKTPLSVIEIISEFNKNER